MKKIIRLTESDLKNMIKKVIKEGYYDDDKPTVLLFADIIEDYQAQEIAEEEGMSEEEAALTWFENVYYDGEWEEQPMPKYHDFVEHSEEGFDLYHDYGAGYYFAVKEEKPEEQSLANFQESRNLVKQITESVMRKLRK